MSCHVLLQPFHSLSARPEGVVYSSVPDVPRHSGPDAEHTRPIITAEAVPGHVRLTCRMAGAESFHIYMRRKGQPAFLRLAACHRSFPFVDDSPLARTGVPETREYLAMGIFTNEVTRQPSDVVAVVLPCDFRPLNSGPPREPITVVCSMHPHHEG